AAPVSGETPRPHRDRISEPPRILFPLDPLSIVLDAFVAQQPTFLFDPRAIAAELSGRGDDAVARDEYRASVGRVRRTHRAKCTRLPHALCELCVSDRSARRDGAHRPPHELLQR